MKGMTVRRATIAALGRTTQISIHIQPPSLLPTRLDIIPCSQLQFQTKDFRKRFRQLYLRPHHGKSNAKLLPLLQEKRERSTDANLKTVRANFLTKFLHTTFLTNYDWTYWLAKWRVRCAAKCWCRLCPSAYCLRPNDRADAQQAHRG